MECVRVSTFDQRGSLIHDASELEVEGSKRRPRGTTYDDDDVWRDEAADKSERAGRALEADGEEAIETFESAVPCRERSVVRRP